MKRFTKRVENFKCEHCGADVVGDGYTNHCPQCLWSKHVDNNPGDRESTCGGMMKPISITVQKNGYIITHKCTECGKEINQHSAENDNVDAIIAISLGRDFIFGGR